MDGHATGDPLLLSRGGLSTEEAPVLPGQIPVRFRDIQQNVRGITIVYLVLVWSIRIGKDGGKNPQVQAILDNARYLFSDEARYKDHFWMEHCASTMRELVLDLTPDDFRKAIKNIPVSEDDPASGFFAQIQRKGRVFLSDVVHMRLDAAQKCAAEILLGDRGRWEEYNENFGQAFESVCVSLILDLHSFFVRYCYTDNPSP